MFFWIEDEVGSIVGYGGVIVCSEVMVDAICVLGDVSFNGEGSGDREVRSNNNTGGSDISVSMNVTPGNIYYVRVSDYYGSAAGAYSIKVIFTP